MCIKVSLREMGSCSVRWKRSAARELRGFERHVIARLVRPVGALSEDPYPWRQKVRDSDRPCRIRVGDHRVSSSVLKDALVVEVVGGGHRRDVYRRLT